MRWRPHGADAQRVAVVGATGSGKTTLVRQLLERAQRVVAYDPKGLGEHGLPAGDAATGERVAVLRDPTTEPDAEVDAVCREVWARGNVLLVLDDAMVLSGTKPPHWLQVVVTMGRSRGIGVLSVVQRPRTVPRILLTEAEHVIAFRVRHPDDAELLARLASRRLAAAAALPRYDYVWCDLEADEWRRGVTVP
ncbi:MAG: type IV secretion system DNA-binding domain-containing protein [Alphaproteobacteria bacterium]|nr:type IV secretion system DNA-binding domain-containing protein [Alphaproteobacteria bacterium]